jgi:hypothetical protein
MVHFVGLDVSVKATSVCVVDDAGAGARRSEKEAPKPDLYAAAGERASFELLPVIRLRRRDQQGSTYIPSGRSASSSDAFPCKVDGFLTRFAILCARKGKLGEPSWLHLKSRQ